MCLWTLAPGSLGCRGASAAVNASGVVFCELAGSLALLKQSSSYTLDIQTPFHRSAEVWSGVSLNPPASGSGLLLRAKSTYSDTSLKPGSVFSWPGSDARRVNRAWSPFSLVEKCQVGTVRAEQSPVGLPGLPTCLLAWLLGFEVVIQPTVRSLPAA